MIQFTIIQSINDPTLALIHQQLSEQTVCQLCRPLVVQLTLRRFRVPVSPRLTITATGTIRNLLRASSRILHNGSAVVQAVTAFRAPAYCWHGQRCRSTAHHLPTDIYTNVRETDQATNTSPRELGERKSA
jgi:hypothetical protein